MSLGRLWGFQKWEWCTSCLHWVDSLCILFSIAFKGGHSEFLNLDSRCLLSYAPQRVQFRKSLNNRYIFLINFMLRFYHVMSSYVSSLANLQAMLEWFVLPIRFWGIFFDHLTLKVWGCLHIILWLMIIEFPLSSAQYFLPYSWIW